MNGLITAEEARGIAAQYPNNFNQYIPAVLEAICEEIRKAAYLGGMRFKFNKIKDGDKLRAMQQDKIVERLQKLGFIVSYVDENHLNGIRVSWGDMAKLQ